MNNFCLSHGGQLPYTIEVECSILKAQPFLKMKPLAPLSIFRMFWSAVPKILFPERWGVQYLWHGQGDCSGVKHCKNLGIHPLDQLFPAGIESIERDKGAVSVAET